MPLSLRGLSFISNRKRYRQDISKHIKRSMYPHVQTSPHGPRLQNHRPLLVFALIACHPSVDSANRCCGADLGHLGLLRHIPHTARAKDVSAQLIGCNWSSGHDLDMDIHALMSYFSTILGRILYVTAGISISQHTTSPSRLGSKETSQRSPEERSMSSSDFPNSSQTGRHLITA
jgi:hypothetical protein